MKVQTLDGHIHSVRLEKYRKSPKNKSSYHLKAREVLRELFPLHHVYEEVYVKLLKSNRAYLDFFIYSLGVVIEVHGEQHFSQNSFMHGDKLKFLQQQRRDRLKREWCELNEFTLIELHYDESEQQWRDKLNSIYE